MSMGIVYVGDVRTPIVLTIRQPPSADGTPGDVVDVSTATTKEFILAMHGTAPGAGTTRAAEYVTDGADGQLAYATVDGDLSAPGLLRVQAHVVLADGTSFRTSVEDFEVREGL
jgi:hypothetical protein